MEKARWRYRVIIASIYKGIIRVAVACFWGGEAGEVGKVLGVGGVEHVVECDAV